MLVFVAWKGHTPDVDELLCRGAVVDARDRGGWAALFIAAKFGAVDCVAALLGAGAAIGADGAAVRSLAALSGRATDVVALLGA